jgi:serine/threonine-protein kinase SRK2
MDNYSFIRKLGSGTFGQIDLYMDRETGETVVIKKTKALSEVQRNICGISDEATIHKKVQHHGNIVSFRGSLTSRYNAMIVMEHVDAGDLFSLFEQSSRFSEDVARGYFRQICAAVAYCHERNICHRDIKMENVLISEGGVAKLCDFGLSYDFTHSPPTTCVGTVCYISPEVYNNSGKGVMAEPYDGTKADVWSCGVMLYIMMYGTYPYARNATKGCGIEEVMRIIAENLQDDQYIVDFPSKVPVSSACVDTIRRMLDRDPVTRPSMEEVMDFSWFRKNLPSKSEMVVPSVQVMADYYIHEVPSADDRTLSEDMIALMGW